MFAFFFGVEEHAMQETGSKQCNIIMPKTGRVQW
jgi:hypothetical protein